METPLTGRLRMSVRFQDLNLAQPLLDATEALGFTTATPVQEQVFPAAMAGGGKSQCFGGIE